MINKMFAYLVFVPCVHSFGTLDQSLVGLGYHRTWSSLFVPVPSQATEQDPHSPQELNSPFTVDEDEEVNKSKKK